MPSFVVNNRKNLFVHFISMKSAFSINAGLLLMDHFIVVK